MARLAMLAVHNLPLCGHSLLYLFSNGLPSILRLSTLFALTLAVQSMSMGHLRGQIAVPLSYQHHNQPAQPPPSLNLRPPILSIPSESIGVNLNSTVPQSFPGLVESTRTKHPLSDKFMFAQQSLNDLFSDLLSKPLGLPNLGNGTFSLEQLITDKVKLPRPLNALIASLAHSDSNNNANEQANSDFNELSTMETHNANGNVRVSGKVSTKSASKKKKNNSLANLVSRCYEPYGCFRISEPFRSIYRPISLIPEPPSAIKVSFHLRSRANPSIAERLSYSETNKYLKSQYFHPGHKLKIIVHGYLESGEEPWIKVSALNRALQITDNPLQEMSGALLNRDEVNVISVDWMLGATPPYTQAVANTRLVGAIIAHLIRIIQDTYPERYPAKKIHIIGHSLGAHIAGYTGQLIANLGHITGLDPAEPYFQYTDPLVRLDPNDANFVDVVHTDVASIISGGFGMNQTCGHVDFYPNGGINQPGCKEAPIKNVWDSISKERSSVFDGIRRFIGCNHLRSFLLYIEAINSECPFMAFPCANYEDFTSGQCTWQLMEQHYYRQCFDHQPTISNLTACPIRLGLDSELDYREQMDRLSLNNDLRTSGLVFFLQTANRAPFCHYHYDLTLVLRASPLRYVRNYRTRQFIVDNSILLNGRLDVSLVGSRGSAFSEMLFKNSDANEMAGSNDRNGETISFKEYHVMTSDADLGNILRIELEWRPSTSIPPIRPLIPKQTRALRRWLPQLSTFEASLPNVLNELQRTLNVNASQLQTHTSNLLNWSSQLTDIINPKSAPDHNAFSEPSPPQKETPPLLEAVIVTKLETGQRQVFCANEAALKMIFQNKPISRNGMLITSNIVNAQIQVDLDDQQLNTESLMLQLCMRDIP